MDRPIINVVDDRVILTLTVADQASGTAVAAAARAEQAANSVEGVLGEVQGVQSTVEDIQSSVLVTQTEINQSLANANNIVIESTIEADRATTEADRAEAFALEAEDTSTIAIQPFEFSDTWGTLSVSNGISNTINRTRIFTKVVEVDSIVKTVTFYMEVSTMSPVSLIVFEMAGEGPPDIGSVFNEIKRIDLMPQTIGVNNFEIEFSILAGQYLGTFSSNYTFPYVNKDNNINTRFVSGSHSGSSVTIDDSSSTRELQIGMKLIYYNLESIRELKTDVSNLSQISIEVIPTINNIPEPIYGKSVLIPNENLGAAWSDGLGWRWYKDNTAVKLAWNDILLQAKSDGWTALFNFGHLSTITLDGTNITRIESLIGDYPSLIQTSLSINPPTLSSNIGEMACANFTGTQNLTLEPITGTVSSMFVVAVYKYTGNLSTTSLFLMDGKSSPGRMALYATTSGIKNFTSAEEPISSLDNNSHITAIQFDNLGGSVWHDGNKVGSSRSFNGNLSPLKIGSDYANARKWVGQLAALLIYNGNPSFDIIKRMNLKLSEYSGINFTENPITHTVNSYSTMRLSDSEFIQGFNENEPLNVASITKLMTLVVSNDYINNYSDTITIVSSDVHNIVSNFVQEGDIVDYQTLFSCSLIVSDNNAPIALARVIGYIINPSAIDDDEARSSFYEKMNEKSVILGLKNCSYTSAYTNGLMPAREVVLLMRHIKDNIPEMYNEWGKLTYTVIVTGVNARSYVIDSSISQTSRTLLPEFIGGKTGTAVSLGSIVFLWGSDFIEDNFITAVIQADPSSSRYTNARAIIDSVYSFV